MNRKGAERDKDFLGLETKQIHLTTEKAGIHGKDEMIILCFIVIVDVISYELLIYTICCGDGADAAYNI